jgi:hypothetical protein
MFSRCVIFAASTGFDICALLDQYHSHSSMIGRLNLIKQTPNIKYVQLFNELPYMIDDYVGEKFNSADELIFKVVEYTNWIRRNIPYCKVVSMATYNNLDYREHKIWNISNNTLLKRLILECDVDVTALNCYGMSSKTKIQMDEFRGDLNDWQTEAEKKYGKRKSIWITECGNDDWKNHIKYYEEWCSRFAQFFYAEKIFFYRGTIDFKDSKDSGFALEIRNTQKKSPLLIMLEN